MMAEGLAHSTQTVTVESPPVEERIVLQLSQVDDDKKVHWEEGTVDNEDMNKKKSKCCCIYKKPKAFDESSSDESGDDECAHCSGHKKDCHKHPASQPNESTGVQSNGDLNPLEGPSEGANSVPNGT